MMIKEIRGLRAIVLAGAVGAAALFGYARGEEYDERRDDYFLANEFKGDSNGNKMADAAEYNGYGKNTFGVDENICLGAIVYDKKDEKIIARISDSKKRIILEFSGVAGGKKWTFTYPLNDTKLMPGFYEVVWKKSGFIDRELNRQKFEIKNMNAKELYAERSNMMLEDLKKAMEETREEFIKDMEKRKR